MCDLNALGSLNFYTEGVPSWGYPIGVCEFFDAIIAVTQYSFH